MKRAILLALALAGCTAPLPSNGVGVGIDKWTDPDTGCVYLHLSRNYAMSSAVEALSIRFRRDGTPDCPGPDVTPMESPVR